MRKKYCPVDGEAYPDSARYCGTHGKKLDTKNRPLKIRSPKTAAPRPSMPKRAASVLRRFTSTTMAARKRSSISAGSIRIAMATAKKESPIREGGQRDHPLAGCELFLPEYGRGAVEKRPYRRKLNLNRGSCPRARIRDIRRKVLIAGYEGEKGEAVEIALSRMEVVSFDGKGTGGRSSRAGGDPPKTG